MRKEGLDVYCLKFHFLLLYKASSNREPMTDHSSAAPSNRGNRRTAPLEKAEFWSTKDQEYSPRCSTSTVASANELREGCLCVSFLGRLKCLFLDV